VRVRELGVLLRFAAQDLFRARQVAEPEVAVAQPVAHSAPGQASGRSLERAAGFSAAPLEEQRAAEEVKGFRIGGRARERLARRALREAEVVALERVPRVLHAARIVALHAIDRSQAFARRGSPIIRIPMKAKIRPIPKGRAVDPKALADVQQLLGDAPRRRDLLIEHLHRINDRFGHLPAAHLAALAQEMRLALAEVYEVATFYHHFEVVKEGKRPPPALTVRVCDSIACELAGARELLQLNLGPGVRVIPAPCVGRCEVAPCVHVGQNPVGNATADRVRAAVEQKQLDCPVAPYTGYDEYRRNGGYRLIAECLAGKHTREGLTKIMEDSALRGLGGAGFPAGRKWRLVAAEPEPRVMALNIDEGEPGTFKDRWYLEREPHRFLEGMLVAAWCAGVGEIWIYLRDEYAGCRQILEPSSKS